MYQVPAYFETPVQGDLNFAFDQRESEVNLHKVTFSPSNVSPEYRNELESQGTWKRCSPHGSQNFLK